MASEREVEAAARAIALVAEQNGAGSWDYYAVNAPEYLDYLRDQARAALLAAEQARE